MTCCVALIHRGISYVAGDSWVGAVPYEHNVAVNQHFKQESKVFKRGNMLFGANGSVRMIQILRYSFQIPEYTPGKDKIHYFVTNFIPALQEEFKRNAFNEGDSLEGGILVAWDQKIYTISNEFGVYDTIDLYDAVGKAAPVALGSLYSTSVLDDAIYTMAPLHRLRLALISCEHHTSVVGPPYHYISSEMEEGDYREL